MMSRDFVSKEIEKIKPEIDRIQSRLDYVDKLLVEVKGSTEKIYRIFDGISKKNAPDSENNKKLVVLQTENDELKKKYDALVKDHDELKRKLEGESANKQEPLPPQTQQYSKHNQTNAIIPSGNAAALNLNSAEKTLVIAINRSLEQALTYKHLALAVSKGVQQVLQASATRGLQLSETNQPTPPYYAFEGHTNWLILPNTEVMWPPLMIQQVGLEILFEMRPNKPPTPKKVKQVLAPARMSRNGDNWSVIQQGVLEFET